jgi:hypothetical protein
MKRKPKPEFWRSKALTKTPEEQARSTSGKASRAKGIAFERRVAEMFRRFYPDARRQLEWHVLDAKGIDLQGTGPLKVQLKKLKSYVSINTINEVQCDRVLGDIPLLITAGDGLEAMAVLPLEDFFRILAWDSLDTNATNR